MTLFIRSFLALIFLAGLAAITSSPASAGDPQIEAAQKQGVVGERIDGYLGIVSGNVDPALLRKVLRKVNEINNKRRALFDRTAQNTGTTTAQVARISGEKQVGRAEAGEFVMRGDGRWAKK